MNKRIVKIRADAGLNQIKFAELLNVSKNYISMIENGKRNPSARLISTICCTFGVNQDWLEKGIGTPYTPLQEDETASYLSGLLTDTDDNVCKLIRGIMKTYCELDAIDQAITQKFAKELLDNLKTK